MMEGIKGELEKLIEEKGHLTIAALTLKEFAVFMENYNTPIVKKKSQEDLISLKELGEKLGISYNTIWRMRNKGKIPEYIIGKKPMFDLQEVIEALKLKY